MTLTPADLHVGQEVILHDVNRRRDSVDVRGVVTKVGRKLVTIKGAYAESQYRIAEQTRNDDYGHGSFRTLEQEALANQRVTDLATLARHGFKLEWNARPAAEDLRRVAELLEADQ